MEEILSKTTNDYFFQKERKDDREDRQHLYEKDGSVIVEFTTGIAQIKPDEEDLIGKIWIPPTKDKDGNPIIDRKTGKVRDAWDKYEAKCKIKNTDLIYGFGGKRGALFRNFIGALKSNELSNSQLPGTRWRIKCNNMKKYDWTVEFLDGKSDEQKAKEIIGDISKSQPRRQPPQKPEPEPQEDDYQRVVTAIQNIRDTAHKPMILSGLGEQELLEAVAYKTKLDQKKVKGYMKQLETDGVVKIVSDKIYIQ